MTTTNIKEMRGILMPVLQHRFRILFSVGTKEKADLLSSQCISFTMDLVNDVYTLILEQPHYGYVEKTPIPVASRFIDVVSLMCKANSFVIRVEAFYGSLDDSDDLLHDEVFVVKHSTGVDYANSGTMRHTIILQKGHRPIKFN